MRSGVVFDCACEACIISGTEHFVGAKLITLPEGWGGPFSLQERFFLEHLNDLKVISFQSYQHNEAESVVRMSIRLLLGHVPLILRTASRGC